jgi:hypothetical protein
MRDDVTARGSSWGPPELERELGIRLRRGALAVLAKETCQAKDRNLDPETAGVACTGTGTRLGPGLDQPATTHAGPRHDAERRWPTRGG